jgi:hypothetical protein
MPRFLDRLLMMLFGGGAKEDIDLGAASDQHQDQVDAEVQRAADVRRRARMEALEAQATVMKGRRRIQAADEKQS